LGYTPIANKKDITDEAKAQSFRKIDVAWKTRVLDKLKREGKALDLSMKDKPL
jgi:hypothetical protein